MHSRRKPRDLVVSTIQRAAAALASTAIGVGSGSAAGSGSGSAAGTWAGKEAAPGADAGARAGAGAGALYRLQCARAGAAVAADAVVFDESVSLYGGLVCMVGLLCVLVCAHVCILVLAFSVRAFMCL